MNEAILPSVSAITPTATIAPGVYVDIADLIRLRFKTTGFSFLPRQPVRSVLAGKHASRLRGRGLNFEEIRLYQPGDDIRQIDWKVTARTRVPHTRVYTEEHGRTTLIVVDQRLSMFFGSRKNFKSVTAAELAALAAWRVIGVKDRVSAIIFGDRDFSSIAPGGSRDHVMRILGEIQRRNHVLSIDAGIIPNPGMLNSALQQAEQLAKHDTLVCVITDGVGHDEETRRVLTRISQHNDVLIALVNDPLEMEMPDAGSRIFATGNEQLQVDTARKQLRESFDESFRKQVETAKRYLLHKEVPLLQIRTDEDVALQLRRLLGTRSR